uniref:Uncharacterized protein n=1 Tax=Bionectria ochroleuca TaxID=29856 RepID=A0A8H7NH14_BIOOC
MDWIFHRVKLAILILSPFLRDRVKRDQIDIASLTSSATTLDICIWIHKEPATVADVAAVVIALWPYQARKPITLGGILIIRGLLGCIILILHFSVVVSLVLYGSLNLADLAPDGASSLHLPRKCV